MWLAVIVLGLSAYTSCTNAQPVITTGTNLHPFQLVAHRNNTMINHKAQSWKTKEVETFTTTPTVTNTPDEVDIDGGADLDGSIDENVIVHNRAWEESGKVEGDMILNDRQRRLILERVEGMERNGLQDITKRWPNNEVIYYIDREHFNTNQVQVIEKSIDELRRASCLKFRPYRNNDRDLVWIQGNKEGCYSHVGYQGGHQIVNLGRGCVYHGIAIHELLHALGFYHMQSNHDRDDYVTIHWNNILRSQRHNFDKYNAYTVTDFGVGYDYDSVMHYDRKAFSANGRDTIVPKQRGVRIGQSQGLSKKDALKLNKMYCNKERTTKKITVPRKTIWNPFRFLWNNWSA